MRITNEQIYTELVDFREETRKQLNALNGRVRETEKGTTVALDRTKRIGHEIDQHIGDKDVHNGRKATTDAQGLESLGTVQAAKITASAELKIAIIGLAAGIGGGLISRLPDILGK